jgi:hypothetical protein
MRTCVLVRRLQRISNFISSIFREHLLYCRFVCLCKLTAWLVVLCYKTCPVLVLKKILSEVRGRGLLHDEQRGFGPTTTQTHHCNWPAWLKEYPGTSATRGSQARSSSLWPRHSTPYGLAVLSTSLWSSALNSCLVKPWVFLWLRLFLKCLQLSRHFKLSGLIFRYFPEEELSIQQKDYDLIIVKSRPWPKDYSNHQ